MARQDEQQRGAVAVTGAREERATERAGSTGVHPCFSDIEREAALRAQSTPSEVLRALLSAAHDEVSQLYTRLDSLEEELEDTRFGLAEALAEKTDADIRKECAALKRQNEKLKRAHDDVARELRSTTAALHDAAQVQTAERVKLIAEIRELKASRDEFDRAAQKALEAATRERDEARALLERARSLAVPASHEYSRVLSELEDLRAQVKELKEVEALATAFAMLVGVEFDQSKLSAEHHIFLHAACTALGRGDLCGFEAWSAPRRKRDAERPCPECGNPMNNHKGGCSWLPF